MKGNLAVKITINGRRKPGVSVYGKTEVRRPDSTSEKKNRRPVSNKGGRQGQRKSRKNKRRKKARHQKKKPKI